MSWTGGAEKDVRTRSRSLRARRREHLERLIVFLGILASVTACGAAMGNPPPNPPEPSQGGAEERSANGRSGDGGETQRPLPTGRAIARLEGDACFALLDDRSLNYRRLDADEAPGVDAPLELRGLIEGIEVVSRGRAPQSQIYDCRLVVALLAWAPQLRDAGVQRIEHMSTYRPGARVARSGSPSGHSRALAIDVAGVVLRDGSELDVETIWGDAHAGDDPCTHLEDESDDLRLLRDAICGAAEGDLFQIVLTPHYDRAHRNHVHLELRGDVDWSYVH